MLFHTSIFILIFTGNFELHLQTVQRMIVFFIATGHISYARSAYIYLQDMINLKKNNPTVFAFFSNGNFITRRTDRFWAGLPDDLIIEQVNVCDSMLCI